MNSSSFFLLIAVVALGGCQSHPSTSSPPMELCVRTAESDALDSSQLARALLKAQAYSEKIYGSDCVVCAQLLEADEKAVELHITSPFESDLINTSATITVRLADGKVLDTAKYHSCHMRRKSKDVG